MYTHGYSRCHMLKQQPIVCHHKFKSLMSKALCELHMHTVTPQTMWHWHHKCTSMRCFVKFSERPSGAPLLYYYDYEHNRSISVSKGAVCWGCLSAHDIFSFMKYLEHFENSQGQISNSKIYICCAAHSWCPTTRCCRYRMSNSSYVGYGDWKYEKSCSSVEEKISLSVKHCGQRKLTMWADKSISPTIYSMNAILYRCPSC